MSEIIHGQVLYLLASTCCGMVCMFLYGFVRIFELFLKTVNISARTVGFVMAGSELRCDD